MLEKRNINFTTLILIYSFVITALFNHTVFIKLNELFTVDFKYSSFEVFFLLLVFLTLFLLLVIFLLLTGTRYLLKPLIGFLLITSSIIFYYKQNYGISVDEGIILSGIDSIKEGNFVEITDLLSFKLLLFLIPMGFLPLIPLLFLRVIYPSVGKELLFRILGIVLILSSLLGLIYANYKNVSLTVRVVKDLNRQTIPHYFISSNIEVIKDSLKTKQTFVALKDMPTTNTEEEMLGIIIIGETARADHFSLNGYSRETNPLLKNQDIINYTDATSCGTLTKTSVPCMFYLGNYNGFSVKKARYQSNALDIASKAGVDVLWVENNSSCKNVCERIKTDIVITKKNDTYDELLIDRMLNFIKESKKKKKLIILHTMGSHGPKYYKRYPKKFGKFTPSCQSNSPQDCSQKELINAYDNTILYTDYVVNSIIDILKKKNVSSFMMYASDHGESLGENGLYLHGVPMKFAPREQIHIPWLMWYSDEYKKNNKIIFKNQDEKITHEFFPHTMMQSLKINSKTLKKNKSLIQLD